MIPTHIYNRRRLVLSTKNFGHWRLHLMEHNLLLPRAKVFRLVVQDCIHTSSQLRGIHPTAAELHCSQAHIRQHKTPPALARCHFRAKKSLDFQGHTSNVPCNGFASIKIITSVVNSYMNSVSPTSPRLE
jgi:hypothetical protein